MIVYSDVNVALADLETLEDLHEDEVIGKYDAAVVDKENGEPHIVKRVDRPRIRVIPELLGSGTLPRRDLKDAAQELGSDQAALIVIGEPTLEKGFDKAVSEGRQDRQARRGCRSRSAGQRGQRSIQGGIDRRFACKAA